MKLIDEYLQKIEKELQSVERKIKAEEEGIVIEVKDGVVILEGLDGISFGELIEFEQKQIGFVIDINEFNVGAVVLGDYLSINSDSKARALGHTFSIPVSQALLGRVVDSLGNPLDGSAKIAAKEFYPVEKVAPGVVQRIPVSSPIQTGIKAIDALIPIGRGQRELIIGDRGTGKTTLAIDTILNQKNENVICIYCAVGQRNSKVASIIDLLKKYEVLKYTIVVTASSSDSAAMQYLAPYSAAAIGEYFMDKGKDVLVIYDDLSKHAWAYREISLILRRPAGREAYPGDIFYLHSRLLERACRLNKKYGGGSLTALPIIETLEGDLSAYIPTNVISITDGQIYLETDLFNAGIRPAINVGLSVSRVGGNAQTKAIKSVSGKLKLDLAQYREMAAFSQFESELDEETKKFLKRGTRITQVLKQKKNQPYSLSEEVLVIWAASNGYLDTLSLDKVEDFETKLLLDLKKRGKSLMDRINKNKVLDKKDEEELKKFVTDTLSV
ncbi:F0F1 ATP synthase subunit alpha [Candidatus Roizmanbacteria bacterium]|nr:F0F1 ATP synthase subunit alpha [Candidatus Roizmanbacteria bacterium]